MFEDQERAEQQQDEGYSYGREGTKDTALIKWQLSGADLVDEIKHRLMGHVFDEVNEVWNEESEPLLNTKGINFVISTLIQTVNKNTILSTLEEDMIFKIMLELDNTLSNNFAIYHKDFGISVAMLSLCKDAVCNQCYFALARALDGGEKKFIGITEHHQYNFTQPMPGQQQKKRTFFGIPLPGGG